MVSTGNVLATPGSGVTPSYKVVSAAVNIHVQTMANKLLLLDVGSDRAPVNILNVHQTFAPGGYSGWHTHSGPGFVIVEQGTITIETTVGCFVDYPQGSALFEVPGNIHNASNRSGTPAVLDAYFFLPAFDPPGANSRVDEPPQYGSCN
jgi:quercetin dioxygenase-like cupin family protein